MSNSVKFRAKFQGAEKLSFPRERHDRFGIYENPVRNEGPAKGAPAAFHLESRAKMSGGSIALASVPGAPPRFDFSRGRVLTAQEQR